MSQIDLLGDLDVGGPRHELDAYDTPEWATYALIHYMGNRLDGRVWEPCVGAGYIATMLARTRLRNGPIEMSDVAPRTAFEGVPVFDFLVDEIPDWLDGPVDWVVTNPPYRTARGDIATDFVRRALVVAEHGVAMLLRLTWLEPCADRVDILLSDPPTDVVILPRVSYIGAPGSNTTTSAWFIWDRSRPGATSMHWYPADIREPTFDWSRLNNKEGTC